VVALAAVILYGEHLSTALAVALVVVFGGILLLNIDIPGLRSKKLNIVPGLKEVGLAAGFAAIWTLGWDKFVGGKDPLTYALLMYVFMSLAAYVLSRIMKVKLGGVPGAVWKFLVLIGLGEAVAYLSISWGFSQTSYTGVVALLSGAFSLPTIVLAYFFLKERITRLQVVAVGLIVFGVVIVSIA
jgi:drug/metabolite transporter (DMT)-like permease